MRQLSNCLVCSGSKFTQYAESTFSGGEDEAAQYFLANRKGVVHGRIVVCESCGFRFTNPQFEAGAYDEIYKKAPRPDGKGVPTENADMRRFHRLARYVRKDVGPNGRFLDFGCGTGGFLTAMNDRSGMGYEVGDPSSRKAGPSTVVTGRFFDLLERDPFLPRSFDFITAFDVFEHLPDLDSYLAALAGLLAPHGRLVVSVPDSGSWAAILTGRRWNMHLLEHLWFFNESTLTAFMRGAGFRQTRHRKLPYDASLAHIARRFTQTYAPRISVGSVLPEIILPIPAGVMYGVFERL
jgi:2-polyprenyl-3-methyl-5-hydroxy-6-metoxy-1,4-benzoquinol methylase